MNKFGHIIVDGPDAVGKSTLGDFIKNKYGFEAIHSDASSPNDFNYHNNLLLNTESRFYDRFMAGEYVYPKIYNRESKLSISEMADLFDNIVKTNSIYIIMNTSDVKILNKRLEDRGEFNYLKEIKPQIEAFLDFAYIFREYFNKYKNNFLYFDINQENAYDKLYDKVNSMIESFK